MKICNKLNKTTIFTKKQLFPCVPDSKLVKLKMVG